MLGISKDGYVRQQRDRSFTPPTVTLDNVCAATAHRITLNFACLSCQFPVVPEVTGRSTFEPNSAGLLWELTMANPLPLCIVDS